MEYETQIVIYKNEKKMRKGIKNYQNAGWEVVSTEAVDQGYGGCKTCLFGCLFLPLALLGKKPVKHKVQYRRKIGEAPA
jgi:hypothetical protein